MFFYFFTSQSPGSGFFLACQVYQKWVNGDINLDIELQGALSEKSPKFVCGDISILKDVVQEHVSSAEKKMIALGKAGPTIEAANIERQAFDIAVANFNHDLGVYKVWFTRNQDREAAVFSKSCNTNRHGSHRRKKLFRILWTEGLQAGVSSCVTCPALLRACKSIKP